MRMGQARSLVQHLTMCGQENVLLMADLNAHCRPWLDDKAAEVQPLTYPLLSQDLWSAYDQVLGEEPDFTSWGGWAGRDVRGVFDYIFFRGETMHPVRVLGAPAALDVLGHPERMPNPEFPSDHIPLVADFRVVCSQADPPSKKR